MCYNLKIFCVIMVTNHTIKPQNISEFQTLQGNSFQGPNSWKCVCFSTNIHLVPLGFHLEKEHGHHSVYTQEPSTGFFCIYVPPRIEGSFSAVSVPPCPSITWGNESVNKQAMKTIVPMGLLELSCAYSRFPHCPGSVCSKSNPFGGGTKL